MQDMVVIQYGVSVIKGYTDRSEWTSEWCSLPSRLSPPIRRLEQETEEQISIEGVKAVFFVHSFEGKSHEDLRFHDHLEPMECLWVRIIFNDEETVEGMIPNCGDFLLQSGFFMYPVDPEGNNWLIYVCKEQVRSFVVLGLRPGPCNLTAEPAGA